MRQAMDPNFESIHDEVLAKRRCSALVIGYKIEACPETEVAVQLGYVVTLLASFRCLDIMSKDKRKLFSLGPSGPPLGGSTGGFLYGPHVGIT